VTCCHTGRENTGAKTPMALRKAIGKESIVIFSGEENLRFHCRSMVTQMPIHGESRAEVWNQRSQQGVYVHTRTRGYSA
jgi:hypothetical protein